MWKWSIKKRIYYHLKDDAQLEHCTDVLKVKEAMETNGPVYIRYWYPNPPIGPCWRTRPFYIWEEFLDMVEDGL